LTSLSPLSIWTLKSRLLLLSMEPKICSFLRWIWSYRDIRSPLIWRTLTRPSLSTCWSLSISIGRCWPWLASSIYHCWSSRHWLSCSRIMKISIITLNVLNCDWIMALVRLRRWRLWSMRSWLRRWLLLVRWSKWLLTSWIWLRLIWRRIIWVIANRICCCFHCECSRSLLYIMIWVWIWRSGSISMGRLWLSMRWCWWSWRVMRVRWIWRILMSGICWLRIIWIW